MLVRDFVHEARLIAEGDDDVVPRREHVKAVLDALDYQRSQWIELLHSLSKQLHALEEQVRKFQLEEA